MSFSFINKRNGVRGQMPPLGSLELEVLDHVWREATVSAQDLHAALEASHGITLSTVQSTVERLCRKDLLLREKQGRAYVYAPAMARSALIACMLSDVIGGLGGAPDRLACDGAGKVDAPEEGALDLIEAWLAACRGSPSSEPAR